MSGAPYVALLRGVNLAARRRVSMGALREALAAAGHRDVRTHLQSGNVVLTPASAPAELARDLERVIADHTGLEVGVVVRSRDELADVVARNPLADVATDPKRHQVVFLSGRLPAEVARRVQSLDVAPEQAVVSGREIYCWHPEGLQRSKLARAVTGKDLGVVATARNWNTVMALLAIADERR